MLNQLQVAMQSNPKNWTENYDIPKTARMLNGSRGRSLDALIEMLEANIKMHPGDASQSSQQALAELRKTRFIACSEDDATEAYNGQMALGHSRYSLQGLEQKGSRAVGLRFTDIPVPQGARVKQAYVLFQHCGSHRSEDEGLVFHGELAANAPPFQNAVSNITSRRKTVASIECSSDIWHPSRISAKHRTPDLASVIQEIADQPDWREGNALVLIISGSSKGSSGSWDDEEGRASAMLYVEVE